MGNITAINQSAFIKGRFIMKIVASAHETIHYVIHEKIQGIVLKLDYEKAFDKVSLEFIPDLLEKRGFFQKNINWMRDAIHEGSVWVRLNNTTGNLFFPSKGIRQGTPVSPSF